MDAFDSTERSVSAITKKKYSELGQHIEVALTDFARMQSSIVLLGLPVHVGSRLSAYRRGALILPAPGKIPPPAGYVLVQFSMSIVE